jgi:hypothetical protein
MAILNNIDQIRKGRLDDPCKEIERITSLFPPEELDPEIFNTRLREMPFGQMLYLQSYAIKKCLEKTYRVFLHGQSSQWTQFVYLMKELFKKCHPELNAKHYKFLRVPKPADFDTFKRYRSGESLSGRPLSMRGDRDPAVSADLVSVNADWRAKSVGESALSFLFFNESILGNSKAIQSACKDAISYFYPDLSAPAVEQIVNLVESIFRDAKEELARSGSLFIIAIPKSQRGESIFYRAHPFGLACTCDPATDELALFDHIQQGKKVPFETCDYNTQIQHRIYIPLLNRNKDRIYHLTSISKSTRHLIKRRIQEILSHIDQTPEIPRNPLMTQDAILLYERLRQEKIAQNSWLSIVSTISKIVSYL